MRDLVKDLYVALKQQKQRDAGLSRNDFFKGSLDGPDVGIRALLGLHGGLPPTIPQAYCLNDERENVTIKDTRVIWETLLLGGLLRNKRTTLSREVVLLSTYCVLDPQVKDTLKLLVEKASNPDMVMLLCLLSRTGARERRRSTITGDRRQRLHSGLPVGPIHSPHTHERTHTRIPDKRILPVVDGAPPTHTDTTDREVTVENMCDVASYAVCERAPQACHLLYLSGRRPSSRDPSSVFPRLQPMLKQQTMDGPPRACDTLQALRSPRSLVPARFSPPTIPEVPARSRGLTPSCLDNTLFSITQAEMPPRSENAWWRNPANGTRTTNEELPDVKWHAAGGLPLYHHHDGAHPKDRRKRSNVPFFAQDEHVRKKTYFLSHSSHHLGRVKSEENRLRVPMGPGRTVDDEKKKMVFKEALWHSTIEALVRRSVGNTVLHPDACTKAFEYRFLQDAPGKKRAARDRRDQERRGVGKGSSKKDDDDDCPRKLDTPWTRHLVLGLLSSPVLSSPSMLSACGQAQRMIEKVGLAVQQMEAYVDRLNTSGCGPTHRALARALTCRATGPMARIRQAAGEVSTEVTFCELLASTRALRTECRRLTYFTDMLNLNNGVDLLSSFFLIMSSSSLERWTLFEYTCWPLVHGLWRWTTTGVIDESMVDFLRQVKELDEKDPELFHPLTKSPLDCWAKGVELNLPFWIPYALCKKITYTGLLVRLSGTPWSQMSSKHEPCCAQHEELAWSDVCLDSFDTTFAPLTKHDKRVETFALKEHDKLQPCLQKSPFGLLLEEEEGREEKEGPVIRAKREEERRHAEKKRKDEEKEERRAKEQHEQEKKKREMEEKKMKYRRDLDTQIAEKLRIRNQRAKEKADEDAAIEAIAQDRAGNVFPLGIISAQEQAETRDWLEKLDRERSEVIDKDMKRLEWRLQRWSIDEKRHDFYWADGRTWEREVNPLWHYLPSTISNRILYPYERTFVPRRGPNRVPDEVMNLNEVSDVDGGEHPLAGDLCGAVVSEEENGDENVRKMEHHHYSSSQFKGTMETEILKPPPTFAEHSAMNPGHESGGTSSALNWDASLVPCAAQNVYVPASNIHSSRGLMPTSLTLDSSHVKEAFIESQNDEMKEEDTANPGCGMTALGGVMTAAAAVAAPPSLSGFFEKPPRHMMSPGESSIDYYTRKLRKEKVGARARDILSRMYQKCVNQLCHEAAKRRIVDARRSTAQAGVQKWTAPEKYAHEAPLLERLETVILSKLREQVMGMERRSWKHMCQHWHVERRVRLLQRLLVFGDGMFANDFIDALRVEWRSKFACKSFLSDDYCQTSSFSMHFSRPDLIGARVNALFKKQIELTGYYTQEGDKDDILSRLRFSCTKPEVLPTKKLEPPLGVFLNSLSIHFDLGFPRIILFSAHALHMYTLLFRVIAQVKVAHMDLREMWKALQTTRCTASDTATLLNIVHSTLYHFVTHLEGWFAQIPGRLHFCPKPTFADWYNWYIATLSDCLELAFQTPSVKVVWLVVEQVLDIVSEFRHTCTNAHDLNIDWLLDLQDRFEHQRAMLKSMLMAGRGSKWQKDQRMVLGNLSGANHVRSF